MNLKRIFLLVISGAILCLYQCEKVKIGKTRKKSEDSSTFSDEVDNFRLQKVRKDLNHIFLLGANYF